MFVKVLETECYELSFLCEDKRTINVYLNGERYVTFGLDTNDLTEEEFEVRCYWYEEEFLKIKRLWLNPSIRDAIEQFKTTLV